MTLPAVIAFYDGSADRFPILGACLLCLVVGGSVAALTRHEPINLDLRRAFLVVTGAWFMAGILGALPYYFSGLSNSALAHHFPGFAECFFESVSGFTTTGSSILGDIESVPRGLLFWRGLTHWLGGMGIVVLSIAILPLLGGGGMNLFKAEAPGGILPDKLAPRIAQTARSMWWVYIVLTVLQTFLLLVGGMDLFDSLCHTFATVATGGFSTKNTSIGFYNSAFIDYVVCLFMFLAGVNFFLHYQALTGRLDVFRKDVEFRFYTLITLAATGILFVNILSMYAGDSLKAFRDALFQVISIATTTGFATADFEKWPATSQFVLLALMLVGGSAGSTAGGAKCLRVIIFFKAGYRELQRILHPHAIIPLRIGARTVPDSTVASVLGFLTCVVALFLVASGMLTVLGVDLATSYSSVLTCICNVGPGLGSVGPTENFGSLPDLAKYILSFCMILGRLEVYTVLVLLTPDFYRR